MGGFSTKATKTIAAIACLTVIVGCSATFRYHGYAPSDDELANLLVGADTRETVEEVVGKPSSSGVLADGDWYYVSSKFRHYAYKAPQPVEREVVVLSFADTGVLENVERFGLEDGRVVALSRRVTDQPVKGPGIISQIIRNIGNVDLGDVFGDG
ncbi:outer membrane protein assembly factor BamE [Amylibacter sp. SFDW26]|uniref:outer membrane protein assembly factor BamE n=1 Tax=Amylibacter sp. SFDW26 TaxID=2652722 RepID=UPI0012624FF1|nr:outer membrane protein assembly factor BamE [Amylibacter sp. SFDW26]KAB7616307.1 outer membrane protein assembly factor BamE [Amylibacter sp. SFDW26]